MNFFWLTGLLLLVNSLHTDNYLKITNNKQTVEVVEKNDFLIPITDFINLKEYDHFTDQLENKIYQEPIDATIDEQGNIISEKAGYKLNRPIFTELFFKSFFENGSSKIQVPVITIYPKVDSELLSQIYSQQISQYTTYFNSYNKTRSHNISLAVKAINNLVLFPGETFSFNKVVGKRTAEKGYLRAPVIIRGEVSEGIGGGICQVSSTLFNAVDLAGMKIVERYSHSKKVPYVPPGRDATVSWYGPDFRFYNKFNQPILIRAKSYGGKVIVQIYSSYVIS